MSEKPKNWYRMYRGWMEHEVFADEPYTEREAWEWLIANAVWEPKTISIKNTPVKLQIGQLSHSLRFLADQWKWKKDRVSRFLAKLKRYEKIATETATETATGGATGQNIITICNYTKYQYQHDRNATEGATETRQQRDKYKEYNNNINLPPNPPAEKSKSGDGDGGDLKSDDFGDGDFSIAACLSPDDRERAKTISGGRDLGPFIQAYDEGVHSGKRSVPRHPARAFLAWLPLYLKKEPAPKPDRATPPKPQNHPPRQDWHDRAEKVFGEAIFNSWIRPLAIENGAIIAPTNFHRKWIKDHYEQDICRMLGTQDITIITKGSTA